MTGLLRARWQQPVVTTPLRAGVTIVGSVFHKKTPGSLQTPNWQSTHPIPLLLPGGGDHYELIHRLRPRSLLVALGRETNGLARQRRIATVARRCGREVENWGDVYCL